MKILRRTTQYKKDFKRYKHQPDKLVSLLEVIRMLENFYIHITIFIITPNIYFIKDMIYNSLYKWMIRYRSH
jgi:hypothetical protein